jgi:hypothetical protein
MRDSGCDLQHPHQNHGGGGVHNAHSYSFKDGFLKVQVGDLDADETDEIYFSPHYWQQFVVDPHDDDPLGILPE